METIDDPPTVVGENWERLWDASRLVNFVSPVIEFLAIEELRLAAKHLKSRRIFTSREFITKPPVIDLGMNRRDQ